MLLTVLSVPDCPNAKVLVDRLQVALRGRAADLAMIVVDDPEQAGRWGMTGSPTLLVDGRDPFATAAMEPSVSCRLHRGIDGTVSGAPSVAELQGALDATQRQADEVTDPSAGALGRGGRGRLAPREGGLRAVQRAVLQSLARSGRPPGPGELDEVAEPWGRTGAQVLRELARQDFLTLDEADQLRAAYPFSLQESRHRVRIEDGPQVWAMCAVDGLGISAMTGREAAIDTTDPLTAEPITVHVTQDGAVASPPEVVVFVGGRACDGPAEQTCCDAVNLFGSRHSAARWTALHPDVRGETLDLRAAVQLGRRIFGDLLAVEWSTPPKHC